MACSPHFIWIYSAWTETEEVSLPSHVYYSFPLKAHYFTAGCVRGGPSLWTLCRGCINQTSHSGEGSTHWHGTAHSTLEDKREKHTIWAVTVKHLRLLKITARNYFPNNSPHAFSKIVSKDMPRLQSAIHHCSSVSVLTLSSSFFLPSVDNKIFAWGNGTSGQ